MLRVSIHAGPLEGISRFNRTDWVDIGYEQLRAVADYKVVLFSVGEGATPPRPLLGYPRWSASLWDLTARAIALGLSPDSEKPVEAVQPVEAGKHKAFADALSAVIEHYPSTGNGGRRLAAMEIVQHRRTRGMYRARVDEDLHPSMSTVPFHFAPAFLRPAELVMRAALVRLTGVHLALPPRPSLKLPAPDVVDGKPYIAIHRLAEPARTGFERWLHRFSEPPTEMKDAPKGLAPETMFAKFLEECV